MLNPLLDVTVTVTLFLFKDNGVGGGGQVCLCSAQAELFSACYFGLNRGWLQTHNLLRSGITGKQCDTNMFDIGLVLPFFFFPVLDRISYSCDNAKLTI